MSHNWWYFWPYAKTAWGWIVAIATLLYAVYRAPRAMLETYEWYMDKFFDSRIREFLETQFTLRTAINGIQARDYIAFQTNAIAKITKMSEKRALNCLKRMKKKKEVIQDWDFWKLAS